MSDDLSCREAKPFVVVAAAYVFLLETCLACQEFLISLGPEVFNVLVNLCSLPFFCILSGLHGGQFDIARRVR